MAELYLQLNLQKNVNCSENQVNKNHPPFRHPSKGGEFKPTLFSKIVPCNFFCFWQLLPEFLSQ